MKKITLLIMIGALLIVNVSTAQNTIIYNHGNKEIEDSPHYYLHMREKGDTTSTLPLKSTKVTIPNNGGTVTIVTDDTGQVRRTVFEIPSSSKKKKKYRGYSRYSYNSFIDLGMNRIDEKNLFSGKEDASSAEFPKLNNNKSVSFAIYPIMATVRPASFIGFTSGLGIEWFNYRFNNGMSLTDRDGKTVALHASKVYNFDPTYSISKSKLTASYLNIPVMLNFYFSRNDYFHIMAGATFGVNIGSHTKVKYTNDAGKKMKEKNDDDLNLNNFRYGFTARVNIGHFGVYANYYMTPLFKSNKGPKVYPFVVGVSLNLDDIWWW